MSQELMSYRLGFDGYIHWVGVIESVQDPLQIGRAKVRIIGFHDIDTNQLAVNDLPWAIPLLPVTQSRVLPDYRIGDWVAGYFLDGKMAQQPIIVGTLPSLPQKGNLQR